MIEHQCDNAKGKYMWKENWYFLAYMIRNCHAKNVDEIKLLEKNNEIEFINIDSIYEGEKWIWNRNSQFNDAFFYLLQ